MAVSIEMMSETRSAEQRDIELMLDLHDDDDMQRGRLGEALTEAAAQAMIGTITPRKFKRRRGHIQAASADA